MLRKVSFLILPFLLFGCNAKYTQKNNPQSATLKIVNKSHTDVTFITYADGEVCKGFEDVEVPMEYRKSQMFDALKPNGGFELKINPIKRFSLKATADGSVYPAISVCTIIASFYPKEKSSYRYTFSWAKFARVCSIDITEIDYDSSGALLENKLDDVIVREQLAPVWNDGAGCK